MDTLNQLGKEGAFELKDIAERGVKAFSMYAAAGGTGVRGVKDVGVALESAVDATGDTTTASTAVENLIRDLQLPKVVKELRRNGINVFGKDGKMRSLPTLMEEIAKKSGNKGAETQSARLLGAGFNQDSILLLSSVTSGKGAENLKRYNGVVADGQGIMKDAEYASKDFTSAVTALTTTWKNLQTAISQNQSRSWLMQLIPLTRKPSSTGWRLVKISPSQSGGYCSPQSVSVW